MSDGPAPGGLTELVTDVMSAEPAPEMPAELSPEELAKMTKQERTEYFKKRNAAKAAAKPKAKQLTKAERRELQEAQRKVKDDQKAAVKDDAEMLEELKLQGLSEEQAKEMLLQLEKEAADAAQDDDDDDVEETLTDSVRGWMKANDQSQTDDSSLRDFNLKVRFQGHVDSTPPDHLRSMLQVIAEQIQDDSVVSSAKQPNAVAKIANPILARWGYLLGKFYKRCDALAAAGIMVHGIGDVLLDVNPVAFVGVLMAVREHVDAMEDEDMLAGCRLVESDSRVFHGFISFLEDAVAEDDEESGSGSGE